LTASEILFGEAYSPRATVSRSTTLSGVSSQPSASAGAPPPVAGDERAVRPDGDGLPERELGDACREPCNIAQVEAMVSTDARRRSTLL
jgi:hypothetical protein